MSFYGVYWFLAVLVRTTILDRAFCNKCYRCPVKELNIYLLIHHTPFLSDAVDVTYFPVPLHFPLTSWANRIKLERLPSVNNFLTFFFLIWMELLLFKTFIAFFPAFTLFFAFLISKKCNLCLYEKFIIICKKELCSLNRRNELASSCPHRNRYVLQNSRVT